MDVSWKMRGKAKATGINVSRTGKDIRVGGGGALPHLHAYNKVTSFKCCRNLLAACATPAARTPHRRLPLGGVSGLKRAGRYIGGGDEG